MHPLEKEILTCIRQEQLLTPAGETVVVAVSGGPDSICLLHLLWRLSGPLNLTLVAAHVNHGLREVEALEEVTLVKKTAEKLGAVLATGVVDVKGFARSHKLSTEHAARLLRYDFLDQVAERHGARKIALAHTADDQVEELLLRLIRGTGRAGLAGMKIIRQGKYIRPLLATPKAQLLDYLSRINAAYAEDSSNREPLYLRNRIRLDLLPYLAREFNPNIRQTILRTAEILQEEEKLLAEIVAKACDTIFIPSNSSRKTPTIVSCLQGWSQGPGDVTELTIDLAQLVTYPRAIQRRVLEEACWRMRNKPSFRQIEQLLHLAGKGGSDGRLHLARGLRVNRFSDRLLLSYPAGMVAQRGELSTDTIKRCSSQIHISGSGTSRLDQIGLSVTVRFLERQGVDHCHPPPDTMYLDLDQIVFPMTLRTIRPGDRFQPLGSPGRKKVSDFLVDQKIARHERWQVPVLLAADSIVALVGLRIDHRFRVTPATRRIMQITWQRA